VQGTFTLAIKIGEALNTAVGDPIAALVAVTGGLPLMIGKVTDVERRTTKGFVRGSVVVEGLGDDAGRLLRLEIQNENLVALEQGRVLASVPDLITVLDSETADAIPTERVRYGQRSPSSRCRAPRSGGARSDWRWPGRARSATTSITCPWRSSPVPALDFRLGIDVGGTNTDAVILDRSDQVLAKAKVPTTPDVTSGIVAALDAVIGTSASTFPGSRTRCSGPRTLPMRCSSAAGCIAWP